jgi:hypothetical protein
VKFQAGQTFYLRLKLHLFCSISVKLHVTVDIRVKFQFPLDLRVKFHVPFVTRAKLNGTLLIGELLFLKLMKTVQDAVFYFSLT